MSRVAKKPVALPKGVEINVSRRQHQRQGPEGHPDALPSRLASN